MQTPLLHVRQEAGSVPGGNSEAAVAPGTGDYHPRLGVCRLLVHTAPLTQPPPFSELLGPQRGERLRGDL